MFRHVLLLSCVAGLAAQAQGMLIPTDTALGPLGIKYQRVSAEIQDGAAVTKVEQVFVNTGPRQLEAHYVFPLPKGAALQDFYLWMNGKKTKGEILEKDKATGIYEGIVRRLQDPALLEYVDTDVFRARVFPVPPNGEMRIELTFSQVLAFNAGIYHYHYPLGAGRQGAGSLKVKQDFTFSASLSSKVPLRSIYSPTHVLGISRQGENKAMAGMEAGAGFDISKDLDLYYTVSDKAIGLSMLTHRSNPDEPGYFLALVSPRAEAQADEVMGKRITFVVDTSGSMMGERIKMARDTLKYCVQRLSPKDEFNVVRFSTDVESLFEKLESATPERVKKAVSFVESFEAIGGTAIDEALTRALKDGDKKGERPHTVLFITDGHPTVGATEESVITQHAKAANKNNSRVFTFGVGEDLNARLLEKVAQEGAGVSDFMRDGKEFEVKVSAFYDKVSHPVLADVTLDLSAFGAFDIYPKQMPDLFKGSQLVVMGRYRNSGDMAVTLRGSVNGAPKVFEYRATAAKQSKEQDFIPRLWAIRKVGYLLDEVRLNGEKPELKQEIITLGKKFGIVTPYTSYLVVEDQPMAANRARPSLEDRAEPREGADFFSNALGGGRRGGALPSPASRPMAAPEAEAMLKKSEGSVGVAVAKSVRGMKEADKDASSSSAARSAGGRTYVAKGGAWVDTDLVDTVGKALKVKYLSEAYFALLKAKPELKAAFALGDRVVLWVGPGKSVSIAPDAGETDAKKTLSALGL
ncbi:MAG: VWA domain-containing protein [Myxococcaceae bacterium]|nr:VWA domain-containing protein [Myxococcaceae bacterium]